MCILCLADICADGSTASADLIGDNGFSFFFELFYKVDNLHSKIHGLCS